MATLAVNQYSVSCILPLWSSRHCHSNSHDYTYSAALDTPPKWCQQWDDSWKCFATHSEQCNPQVVKQQYRSYYLSKGCQPFLVKAVFNSTVECFRLTDWHADNKTAAFSRVLKSSNVAVRFGRAVSHCLTKSAFSYWQVQGFVLLKHCPNERHFCLTICSYGTLMWRNFGSAVWPNGDYALHYRKTF